MKNLIPLLIFLVTALTSVAQTFEIGVKEIRSYKSNGKQEYKNVLDKHFWDSGSESVNCTYVFDMDNKTSIFYNEGYFVNTLKFTKMTESDGVYTFEVKDYNKYNPKESITTVFVLDTKTNNLFMSWYDPIYNTTRTQTHTKFKFKDFM
jgi:hypothetical protein